MKLFYWHMDILYAFYYSQIRDGGPYGQVLGKYCGDVQPGPVLSTLNILWIRFYSDGISEGEGVRAVLETVDCKKHHIMF